ncbi:hypothetical protein SNE25_18220 [Mucilaginibacter sabulilitoris]|uniref:Uncharacterized protein n=1 Tax=Mucilaginibacter sabulilitoris TaxID=1173583 RepID=A0ABZ0TJ89_9SPHI|nr:hypothetical protein [Mucilaginibacter sabulilitoris]WPU91255.1 hypothetical protein SNE25_18220 [Mucilaginibacter sabulilitoris]
MKGIKKPLYRKENKVSLNSKYNVVTGSEFRYQRHTKAFLKNESSHLPMNSGKFGYDYTPLFKFLLSKVGENWDLVFSEAKSRLDKEEPIFWLVALHPNEKRDIVGIGDSTYYSGLFVDGNGLLQKVNPDAQITNIRVHWNETLSFNGKQVVVE